MNYKWIDLRAPISNYWGKISEEDIARIGNREDALEVLIQERYGCPRCRAQRDIKRFLEKHSTANTMSD